MAPSPYSTIGKPFLSVSVVSYAASLVPYWKQWILLAILFANLLKRCFKFLRTSLIPTSVLAGIFILLISTVFKAIAGYNMFDSAIFNNNGTDVLEIITYHCLAIGFIAQALKISDKKFTKIRSKEIFDSGVSTVATYLLQAVLGFGITLFISYVIMPSLFPASGILLPFGYGQGTGQALNFGKAYQKLTEGEFQGANFGLSIAALGFLSASVGGVVYLNIFKKRHNLLHLANEETIHTDVVQEKNELPMQSSVDNLSIQLALIALVYAISYAAMYGLSALIPSMQATIYGFNFLFGVLFAALIKLILKGLNKAKVVKKQYQNNFLLTRIGNAFFDIMIVAGIAAIDLFTIKDYWHILLVLGLVGLISTFLYNRLVAKKLFYEYRNEQFLAMYGMLTGTASTGIMLLREVDPDYKTPAADNLVYQSLPAIVFGFPMMLLANLAPKQPLLTFGILCGFFLVMNIILFRKFIFRRRKKKLD